METQLLMFDAILRTDFKSFVVKVFNEVSGNSTFLDNWHIDLICAELLNMITSDQNRLIINIPPRSMKSIICSIALPAYLLGLDPTLQIMCVSYSDDLATKFANDCRNVMLTDWYQRIFPNTRLSKSRRSITDFETTHHGGRFATSIGGTITGRGAEWIIIDDPLKPNDANSDTMREHVNEWFGSTLFSRLNNKNTGKIILIMQRLHQNDLTGWLLDSQTDFKLIKLSAIAQDNEYWDIQSPYHTRHIHRAKGRPLHEAREDLNALANIRLSLGETAFAGQYQQEPAPREGAIVKKDWLHFYNELPPKFLHTYLSWDTAEKTGGNNAFSACVTFGIGEDHKMYVLDCWRGRLEFPELARKIVELHKLCKEKYKVEPETIIEDKSSGTPLIQYLNNQKRTDGYYMKITPIIPTSDKAVRLSGTSPDIESGKILFPNIATNWWREFEQELLTFPNSTFKDQCDAFSQGAEYISPKAVPLNIRVTII